MPLRKFFIPFAFTLTAEAALAFIFTFGWILTGYSSSAIGLLRALFFILWVALPAYLNWRYFRRAADATEKTFALAGGISGFLVSIALVFYLALSTL